MKIYKGNILFAQTPEKITQIPNGYIVVDDDGKVAEVCSDLKGEYGNVAITDFGDKLLIPGFVDVHMHSSQFAIRGIGYDDPSLDRIVEFLHPIEKQYQNLEYAKKVNEEVVRTLKENGTTRAVMMSATDIPATKDMFQKLKESGIGAYIGKMNSDYTMSQDEEAGETTEVSQRETLEFIEWAMGQSNLAKPIVSPEFVPCCTKETLKYLGDLAQKYNLPVQSHMSGSEAGNIDEIMSRFPEQKTYADIYNSNGLFGQTPTVIAHCVETSAEEKAMMRQKGVFLAHCPVPYMNVPSPKIFPVSEELQKGMHIGLGSDMGGGHLLDMAKIIVAAMQLSKRLFSGQSLSFPQAFYLATKGGGKFFGKVGSFEPGYAFDCLVIDDSKINHLIPYTLQERLQRYIYVGTPQNIEKRFVEGKELVV